MNWLVLKLYLNKLGMVECERHDFVSGWSIASPSANNSNNVMDVWYNGNVNNNNYTNDNIGFRPLAS